MQVSILCVFLLAAHAAGELAVRKEAISISASGDVASPVMIRQKNSLVEIKEEEEEEEEEETMLKDLPQQVNKHYNALCKRLNKINNSKNLLSSIMLKLEMKVEKTNKTFREKVEKQQRKVDDLSNTTRNTWLRAKLDDKISNFNKKLEKLLAHDGTIRQRQKAALDAKEELDRLEESLEVITGKFPESASCDPTTTTTTTTTIPTRIVDGTSNMGRLEVNVKGFWGTVCDDKFNVTDAGVACREIGQSNGKEWTTGSVIVYKTDKTTSGEKSCGEEKGECGNNGEICCGIQAHDSKQQQKDYKDCLEGQKGWQKGCATNIHMDNVACTGSETSLHDCDFNPDHYCDHEEDIVITCS